MQKLFPALRKFRRRIQAKLTVMVRPPLPLGLIVNFCIIFALFLQVSFRDWTVKSVSQGFWWLSVFSASQKVDKNCVKMHTQTYHFGEKMIFFLAQPLNHTQPHRHLRRLTPSLLKSCFMPSQALDGGYYNIFTRPMSRCPMPTPAEASYDRAVFGSPVLYNLLPRVT